MADYVSVLNKAIEGLSENTVETRAEMYSKAQGALQRQLDALGDAMTPAQVEAQLASLKDAVAEVEALFAPAPSPDELLAAGLEDALGSDAPEPAAVESEVVAVPVEVAADVASDEAEADADVETETADDDVEASAAGALEPKSVDDETVVEADQSEISDVEEVLAVDAEPEAALDEDGAGESLAEEPVDIDGLTDAPANESLNADDETGEQSSKVELASPEVVKSDGDDAPEVEGDSGPEDSGKVFDELDAIAGDGDEQSPNDSPLEDDAAKAAADLADDTNEVPGSEDGPGDADAIAAAAAATATARLGSLRPDSTLSFAAKSRLDEAFGKAESKFSRPRPLASEGDPMSRVQSAVAELEAEAERSGNRTSDVISFADARSNAQPEDPTQTGGNGSESDVPDAPAMENVANAANDAVPRMEDLRVEPIEIPTNGAGSKAWLIWLCVVFIVAGGGAWMYLNRDTVLPTLQSMMERVRSIEGESAPAEDPKIDDRVPAAGSGSETETEAATPDAPVADEPVARTITAEAPPADDDVSLKAPEGDTAPGAEVAASDGPEPANLAELPLPPIGSEYALLYEEGSAEGAADLRYGGGIHWSVVQEPGADGSPETVLQARTTKPMNGLSMSIFLRKNTDASLPASHTIEVLFAVPDDSKFGKIGNIGGILLKASEPERGQPLIGAAAPVTDGFFIVGLSNAEQDLAVNLELLRARSWFDIPVLFESGKRGIFTLAKGTSGQAAFEQAFAAWGEGG